MSENSEVESRYIIETLLEENRTLNESNLYLKAVIRQFQSEFAEAKALWEAEKKSLTPGETE